MKGVLFRFPLATIVFFMSAPAALAQQALQDNQHYQAFRSWAIDTQQPNPVPNSSDVDFYNQWITGMKDLDVDDIVDRWRHQNRLKS